MAINSQQRHRYTEKSSSDISLSMRRILDLLRSGVRLYVSSYRRSKGGKYKLSSSDLRVTERLFNRLIEFGLLRLVRVEPQQSVWELKPDIDWLSMRYEKFI